jgi:transitional endoplasmic reticulum ATPase
VALWLDFQPDIPAVTFDDVGGLDGTVERLRERLVYPQEYGDLYENSHLSTSAGVLLHGPPGTGKTLLAKALANETERPFYAIEGAAVKSKWLGESEERVTELFRVARNNAPSILFFDEFDALAVSRKQTHSTAVQSTVNTLLAELDGVGDT